MKESPSYHFTIDGGLVDELIAKSRLSGLLCYILLTRHTTPNGRLTMGLDEFIEWCDGTEEYLASEIENAFYTLLKEGFVEEIVVYGADHQEKERYFYLPDRDFKSGGKHGKQSREERRRLQSPDSAPEYDG